MKPILKILVIIIAVFFAGLFIEDYIEGLPASAIPLEVPSEILYEILPILMSFSIFTLTWFAYSKSKDNQCLFMGMVFLVIGLIDLCHTLSYPYMPNFITPNSLQKSAVLHSEARLISAVLFVAGAYIEKDSLPELINKPVLFVFAIILFLASLVPALFYLDSLPPLYSDGGRSTALIIRQFITLILLLYASYLFIRRYQRTGERYLIPLVYGFIILIISDLVYFNYGMPGHLLKLTAFFFLYLAFYKSSVELPYEKLEAAEERLLHTAEEKYRNLFDNANDAIITTDPDGRITSWNKSAQRIFGWTGQEAMGKDFFPLICSERIVAENKELTISSILARQIVSGIEKACLRKDETKIYVSLTASSIRDIDQNIIGMSAIIRDTTERKLAEDALRESEERYRKLVEFSPYAIAVHSEGKIVFTNPAGAKLLGAENPEQLIGKPIMDIVHPDYRDAVEEQVRLMEEKGINVSPVEEKFVRLDGSAIDVEVTAIPFTYRDKPGIQVIIHDITERKRGEERLRLFRSLVNQSNDAIFVDDTETGRILDANYKACHSLGYTREELLRMHAFDIETTLPGYFSWKEHVEDVKKKGYVVVEGIHRRKDGTTFPVEVNVTYTDIGKNSYIVAIVRDITERKRAEETLRRAYGELELRVKERTAELAKTNEALEAEIVERKRIEAGLHLFRFLIDQFNDALFVADAKTGHLLDVNDTACRNLGYSREELLNMSVMDVDAMVPDYLSWQKNVAEIREKGSVIFEGKHRRKDGTLFSVEISIRFIIQNNNEYIVGVARDITERKQIEEELRRSIRQLNAILTNIPDIAWLKDKESRFIAVNKPFADTAGMRPADLIGKTDFDIWPKELAERYRADDREVMATGRRKQVIEPLVDKEDKKTWIETIKTPIHDDRGNIIGTTGIAHDVTERKRLEEEREKWTAELARSNAELEQFAYIASHDIQEPLRMVSSFTQLLAKRYKDRLDKDADEFIAYIIDGTTRMQRMIEDLLAYSRVGTRGKSFEPTDLEDILNQAVTNLKVVIEENKAVATHDPLPTVMADSSQMVQLFQNLISNAIKFRGEEPPRIHISAQRKGDDWVFSVEDNGIGISPEFMGHLFQIFQREHAANKYPGTGIGLAICKRIVERHGGRIWAESVHGRGSIFYFTIPARKGNR
jgi:PAS domain S-box-containing protein